MRAMGLAAGLSAIDFQAAALELQAQRGRVLASNIANADTPDYAARDFDFQRALAVASSAGGARAGAAARPAMARTRPGHLAGVGAEVAAAAMPALQYRLPLQSALDGNTVDLDVERARFAENAVRYEATLRFLNGQFKQMMTAVNGQ